MAEHSEGNQTVLVPYRVAAIVPVPKGKKRGFIVAPKPPPKPPKVKPHKCKLPGEMHLFWRRITFRPIYHSSLWRCPCGQVYKRNGRYTVPDHAWYSTDLTEWINEGGIE